MLLIANEMLQVTTQDTGVANDRQALLRELCSIENGPILEVEKSIAARKKLETQAEDTLKRFTSDLDEARIELKRKETVAESSRKELEMTRRNVAQVETRQGCRPCARMRSRND